MEEEYRRLEDSDWSRVQLCKNQYGGAGPNLDFPTTENCSARGIKAHSIVNCINQIMRIKRTIKWILTMYWVFDWLQSTTSTIIYVLFLDV